MRTNLALSAHLGVAISAYPMRYVPVEDVERSYIGPHWRWRYLRGMRCILLVTRGVVSPHAEFFERAFGRTPDEFVEILSMPDRYIIWRDAYETNGAAEWRRAYRSLSPGAREELLDLLAEIHRNPSLRQHASSRSPYASLIEHYYPGGASPPNGPPA